MMLVGQMHGNTITCGECATEIIKGNWARHVRARHLEKKKMYLCPIRTCGQSIGRREDLRRHLVGHHQLRPDVGGSKMKIAQSDIRSVSRTDDNAWRGRAETGTLRSLEEQSASGSRDSSS